MSSNPCYPLTALGGPLRAKRFVPSFRAWIYCFAIWIGMSACNASSPPTVESSAGFERISSGSATQSDLKQHQIAFLKRIRKADPQHSTIERAVFNERNELGLILNRSVEMDKISALMRSMLIQMAHEFPNQDLTILAYAPSNPPRKIGTARLNARTRDMSYTPEH
jgi:hypothetical protein